MIRVALGRLLAMLAPSAPHGIAARAALTGPTTPVPERRGEATSGTGPDSALSPWGGNGGRGASPAPRPPHPDLLLNWRPSIENRGALSDVTLALVVGEWAEDLR